MRAICTYLKAPSFARTRTRCTRVHMCIVACTHAHRAASPTRIQCRILRTSLHMQRESACAPSQRPVISAYVTFVCGAVRARVHACNHERASERAPASPHCFSGCVLSLSLSFSNAAVPGTHRVVVIQGVRGRAKDVLGIGSVVDESARSIFPWERKRSDFSRLYKRIERDRRVQWLISRRDYVTV